MPMRHPTDTLGLQVMQCMPGVTTNPPFFNQE